MEFRFEKMKEFWRWVVVMIRVAQACEYTE